MVACDVEITWDGVTEVWEEAAWEEDNWEEATREGWDADAGWIEAELLRVADTRLVDALLTGILLPRIRGWLVVDELVNAAWERDDSDDDDEDDNGAIDEDDGDDDCELELTEALPVNPEALGLVFEDPATFTDELLDTSCDSTIDRLAVELVGFTPGTPAWPLVRVTIGFVLGDDEADWLLADDEVGRLLDDEMDRLLADMDGWSTAIAPAPVVTLDDATMEDDLALTTPLVRVILGDADLDIETDELGCTADAPDEICEGDMTTVDDELFKAEEEAWPRVAVTEGLVLELLTLNVLETFAEDDTEDFDEDFAELEVVLTVNALVLDVLVAELKMHVQALETCDADRPGIGELVLVSAAHHLQKGVV
jgi:hypothetical protein